MHLGQDNAPGKENNGLPMGSASQYVRSGAQIYLLGVVLLSPEPFLAPFTPFLEVKMGPVDCWPTSLARLLEAE